MELGGPCVVPSKCAEALNEISDFTEMEEDEGVCLPDGYCACRKKCQAIGFL